ncbi:MAG: hypothetical protein Q8O88_01280 [bacterium]|nr:hypothetical protein [bacterium]
MARLFEKTDGHIFDARDVNETYAHIFGNMVAFALDGLGSTDQTFVYTDTFATNTGSILTNVTYGTGSFGHGGANTGSLILNPITIGSVFDTIVPFVQGSFVNIYNLYFSFDNGATYTEYRSRELDKADNVTGSGIVIKIHFDNVNSGSDIVNGIGFYFG